MCSRLWEEFVVNMPCGQEVTRLDNMKKTMTKSWTAARMEQFSLPIWDQIL